MVATKSSKKRNSLDKLKVVVEKLQKSLSLAMRPSSESYDRDFEAVGDSLSVPEDVKDGHFAVIVVGGGLSKRYVIALNYLTHPRFLRLLEQSAEEYGFDHQGALTIPCRSTELESILSQKRDDNGVDWDSCKTMAKSCQEQSVSRNSRKIRF